MVIDFDWNSHLVVLAVTEIDKEIFSLDRPVRADHGLKATAHRPTRPDFGVAEAIYASLAGTDIAESETASQVGHEPTQDSDAEARASRAKPLQLGEA